MNELIYLSKILDKELKDMTALEYCIFALSSINEDRAEKAAEQLQELVFERDMYKNALEEELGMK